MRIHHCFATATLLLGTFVHASVTAAQPGVARGRTAGMPFYDTTTVQTLTGTIERIDTITTPRVLAEGIHVQLRTGSGTVPVHLGPAWYMDAQEFTLTPGDRITVRGSRVTFDGAPAVVAAEVTRDRDRAQLRLRNTRGLPAWSRNAERSGRGRRTP